MNEKQYSNSKHVNEKEQIARNVFFCFLCCMFCMVAFAKGQDNIGQFLYCNMFIKLRIVEVRQVNIMVFHCYIIHMLKPVKQHIYDQMFSTDC